jgi:ABC-type transport system involved in cytochrome c biogenesis permease component
MLANSRRASTEALRKHLETRAPAYVLGYTVFLIVVLPILYGRLGNTSNFLLAAIGAMALGVLANIVVIALWAAASVAVRRKES